jgi:hypothetical protein
MNTISKAPVVVLSNGLRVANFSSPHTFNFEDGNILEACAPDRVAAGALDRVDEDRPWPGLPGVTAVVPVFRLSASARELLMELQADENVDVILSPLPVIDALRRFSADGEDGISYFTKAATICVKDRQTKTIFINRFCR